MNLALTPLLENHARSIFAWRYTEPYDFYNLSGNEDDALDEMLNGSHYAVLDGQGVLAGFFAFGSIAQVPGGRERGLYRDDLVLDIGLGMRPDLTGQGVGRPFVAAGIDFAEQRFKPPAMRLTVATFNRRAILVYQRAGFREVQSFFSPTPNGEAEFVLMSRDCVPAPSLDPTSSSAWSKEP